MHLVFLNQYYPPDAAPTGVMLEGLVERLIKDGHEVTVLCASGGYAEEKNLKSGNGKVETGDKSLETRNKNPESRVWKDGKSPSTNCPLPTANRPLPTGNGQATILRIGATRFGRRGFAGKLMDYASYYLGVAWKIAVMHPRPDRVVALTTPPFLSVMARALSRFHGGDHAHWVMDLYPDVMTAHGIMKDGGLLHRLLARLAGWGFGGRRCALILTLGPDMAERTEKLLKKNLRNTAWVPLWGASPPADEISLPEIQELHRMRGWSDDELIVMYSGNMGLGHRFDELLTAAQELSDQPFRFVFCGDGKRRREIKNFANVHPECQIELRGYAPAEELSVHLMSADVHVASLDPAWTGTMVPSKLQGVFAVGKPLIFIGSSDSSIGRWVHESGGGWLVNPDDVTGLIDALQEARDPEIRRIKGAAARAHALRFFDKKTNISQIVCLLTVERSMIMTAGRSHVVDSAEVNEIAL